MLLHLLLPLPQYFAPVSTAAYAAAAAVAAAAAAVRLGEGARHATYIEQKHFGPPHPWGQVAEGIFGRTGDPTATKSQSPKQSCRIPYSLGDLNKTGIQEASLGSWDTAWEFRNLM
eukprot:gene1648-biopygen10886